MNARHRLQNSFNNPERIRKFLILILILVLAKVIYTLSALNSGTQPPLKSLFNPAIAAKEESEQKPEDAPAEKKAAPDNATRNSNEVWSQELVNSLMQREAELNLKADSLRRDEERLAELKRTLDGKIQTLSQIEKKISELVATKKGMEEEKILKLAKVFEETPPEQAGPLLSKLDVDIAAELILKMTGRKAGKIWGYVDPERAVEISKVLARLNPNLDMNKLSDNKSAER